MEAAAATACERDGLDGGPMTERRSYGSGRIYVRMDVHGREAFYGSWYANGRRVKRGLGVTRAVASGRA